MASNVTDQQIAEWAALVQAQMAYYRVATIKRAFAFTATEEAAPIGFSDNRLASIFIPTNDVWMGGDNSVTPLNGLPVAAGSAIVFGPEEGKSKTYLVTASGAADVRCLELLTQ